MAAITFENLLGRFTDLSGESLDRECTDQHITDLSHHLDKWKILASYLHLTQPEVDEVDSDGKYELDKRLKILQKWKRKFAYKATYRKLIHALLNSAVGRADLAQKVCKMLQKERDGKDNGEPQPKHRKGTSEDVDFEKKLQEFQLLSLRGELKEKKDELQEMEEALLKKDDKISSLQTQIGSLQDRLTGLQAQQGLPLNLRWKQSKDMPVIVGSYTYSVVLQGKVYVSGESASSSSQTVPYTVIEYDPHSDEWCPLPEYKAMLFGMAVLNGQLVLVGGQLGLVGGRFHSVDRKVTKEIAEWDPQSKNWTSKTYTMRTGRYRPAVTTYNKWLVVAGGCDENGNLDVVEILDTSTEQWYSAAPLPVKYSYMRSAVVRDDWYLTGCYDKAESKHVFSVSLPALILFAETASQVSSPLWCTLPNSPMLRSTPLAFHESLLAVGGNEASGVSSAIHLYQPWNKKWVKAGDLPVELSGCTCTELPSGKLLVVGGSEPRQNNMYTVSSRRVSIATVMDS